MKTDSQKIDACGGTAKTARLCKMSMQVVSNWRRHGIPAAWLMYLEVVKPDIFGTAEQAAA